MDDDKRNEDHSGPPRIKVTDRRKFNRDGSPREAEIPPEDPSPESTATEIPIVGDEPEAASRPGPTPAPGDAPATSPRAPSGTEERPPAGEATSPPDSADADAGAGARPGAASDPSSPAASGAPSGATPHPSPGAPDAPSDASPDARADARAGAAPDPSAGATPDAGQRPRIAELPRDFTAFVESMYLEAMLFLGAIPDPRTGEVAEDLEMAKYKIDLLGLLQEKTEGNLTADESRQLEEVLYQVRMFYVQRTGTQPPSQG